MTELSWHQARAAGLHALPYDIMGYAYRADLYCPGCIVGLLTTNPGNTGHGTVPADHDTEVHLNLLARIAGIDRADEHSFDSNDFPKVVFRDQLEGSEHCGSCGGGLS
jgi:hypothetical protein